MKDPTRTQVATTEAPVPTSEPDVANGEQVFTQFCTACHQADGSGRSGATQLAASFRDDPTRLAKTDAELLDVIEKGKTGTVGTMPPWGATLNEQKRRDVLAYIRATWAGGEATEPER